MIRLLSTDLLTTPLRLRIPFKYGITTLTEVTHLFVCATLEVNGRAHQGVAADSLAPKWFTKDPNATFAQEEADMLEVIRHACAQAREAGAAPDVFTLWQRTHSAQAAWAATRGFPPLLWNFGVSLIERACLDAFCRATRTTFAHAVRENTPGIRLGEIHPELSGGLPSEFLPAAPLERLTVRHTVGLIDPLTSDDIAEGDRVDDGLPQSLDECIRRHGLTHFKIKLGGNVDRDRERLGRIAALLQRTAPGYAFTLDGNENYRSVEPFRALWDGLQGDRALAGFLGRLIFVEQPLHRDVALSAETAAALCAWSGRPPMIIDESGGEASSLRTALDAGYAGISHKNCKGVFLGIANACLAARRRLANPAAPAIISGEDLVNVGPVALLQDLAVVAALGIPHVERNGHHYFAGLRQFPAVVQEQVLARHGDLYALHTAGFPTLAINNGAISTQTVNDAPFGCAVHVREAGFHRAR